MPVSLNWFLSTLSLRSMHIHYNFYVRPALDLFISFFPCNWCKLSRRRLTMTEFSSHVWLHILLSNRKNIIKKKESLIVIFTTKILDCRNNLNALLNSSIPGIRAHNNYQLSGCDGNNFNFHIYTVAMGTNWQILTFLRQYFQEPHDASFLIFLFQ